MRVAGRATVAKMFALCPAVMSVLRDDGVSPGPSHRRVGGRSPGKPQKQCFHSRCQQKMSEEKVKSQMMDEVEKISVV